MADCVRTNRAMRAITQSIYARAECAMPDGCLARDEQTRLHLFGAEKLNEFRARETVGVGRCTYTMMDDWMSDRVPSMSV